ncbi:DUF2752 domain-containing protein [Mucilaginibacter myungsuensis]|uniref:DUF2752 domain-containing protein n=1 Tax=Mucilaginibacter myungsuensis TaxID=649104 RepID=A0A929PV67_9SPHI|nr:DUF2752 domain-containing protein [Mucilaginibacter myungsuensis]MBE9660681.1 DUF2752 domain-containing protein [Mucilaginibacter myungsuensis]MDN3600726.1 DUF2752 domain-containing protein [Mucilaginibacter myungsuensis]
MSTVIGQLQNYLLPCYFKQWTGFDCPGCGFQRSVIALARGNILQSFSLYPATIPVLLAVVIAVVDTFKPQPIIKQIKTPSYIFAASVIIMSYAIKLGGHLIW